MRQLNQIVRRALPPYPPHRLCELAHALRPLRLFQTSANGRVLAQWAQEDQIKSILAPTSLTPLPYSRKSQTKGAIGIRSGATRQGEHHGLV